MLHAVSLRVFFLQYCLFITMIWNKALYLNVPYTLLLACYQLYTIAFVKIKYNKLFQNTVHLNDIQLVKFLRKRSENKLYCKLQSSNTYSFFSLDFKITKNKYPSQTLICIHCHFSVGNQDHFPWGKGELRISVQVLLGGPA